MKRLIARAGAGTAWSSASSSVHRPSPAPSTYPRSWAGSGARSKATCANSSTQYRITLRGFQRRARDGGVHGRAGGDHQLEDARWLQLVAKIFQATGSGRPLAGKRRNGIGGSVEDHDLVAALHEADGHARSHPPEPDHRELHQAWTVAPTDWPIFTRPCATSRT